MYCNDPCAKYVVNNRKRQSSVAQRMLENREVRRRQPVLAGRASPLSPSLHRADPFNLPTPSEVSVPVFVW